MTREHDLASLPGRGKVPAAAFLHGHKWPGFGQGYETAEDEYL